MISVYTITLRQLSGRLRLFILAVLATLPVFVTALVLRSDSAPQVGEFEIIVLSTMLAGSIAPLVVLAIASAAFGNEVEDRTLANLTLSPIPRWQIALPKLLAAITVAGPFVVGSGLVTGHLAFLGDGLATTSVAVASLIGVALYASAFLWLGLVSSYAIGVGLLYIVLWEGFFSGFVEGVRILSIRHYAVSWMHALDARRFAGEPHPDFAVLLAVTVLVFGGFLWLSVRRLRRMDVP